METQELPQGLRYYRRGNHDGIIARYYAANGKIYVRFFRGEDAVEKGQRWLLQQLTKYKPRVHGAKIPRSNTGYLGVCFRCKKERSGTLIQVFDVTYRENGIRKTKSFVVNHYASMDSALQKAVEFRAEKEYLRVIEKERKLANIWQG